MNIYLCCYGIDALSSQTWQESCITGILSDKNYVIINIVQVKKNV